MEQNPRAVIPSSQDIDQDLINHIQDYKFYSEGSIYKELHKQLLIAFVNQYPQCQQTFNIEFPQLKSTSTHIQQLQLRFREQIIPLDSELSKAFKKLKKSKSKYEHYSNLSMVRSKFQRINILELQRLVIKAKQAKTSISGKDVILFIGSTGSGKTTNILKFLDYQLKQSVVNGLTTLVPIQQLSIQHASFITSPEATSITRYINAAQVPDKMYYVGTHSTRKTFYFCDSPGFGDTAGVEVDKANGLGLIDALKGCRSLRVVLIFPYGSITADRGSDIEKMGTLISRIFSEVKELQRSFTVLFNKVPKGSIKEVHNLIESKICHLKVDQATLKIIKAIQSESANQENYVYPLQTNYKKLFQSISTKKDSIVQLKSLKYKSQPSTDSAISIYIEELSSGISADYRNTKYLNAKDRLRLLHKAKIILDMDDIHNIHNSLSNVSTIISDSYKKSFDEFRQSISQYFRNGKNCIQLIGQIKLRKNNVSQISDNFGGIISQYNPENISISEELKKIAVDLQDYFDEINDKQAKLFLEKVGLFAKQMQVKQFEAILLTKIETSFQRQYERMIKILEAENSNDLHLSWQKLTTLHSQLLILDSNHLSKNLLANIKTEIQNLFDNSQRYIKTQILDRQNRLSIPNKWATQCKANLSRMKDVSQMMPLQSNSFVKAFNSCVKNFKNKYDREQAELQSIIVDLLQKDLHQYVQIFPQKLKQLSSIQRQLKFLQTLLNEEMLLKTQRNPQNAISSIRQNKERLCNFIIDLQRYNKDQIEKDFTIIKNNAQILFKCCELIGKTEMLQKIKQDIFKLLQGHMVTQKKQFSKYQIKLTSNIVYDIEKLKQKYKKIMVFNQFQNSFGAKFNTLVQEVNNQFYEQLKKPYLDYRANGLQFLIEKDHFSHIPMALLNFEKFCTYSLGIDEMIGNRHPDIRAEQQKVKQKMKKYLDLFYQQAQNFNSVEIGYTNQPQDLKDVIRVLVAIMTKASVHRYLNQQMNFDLTYIYQKTKEQIQGVKRKIEDRFEDLRRYESQINELSNLSTACDFYKSLEDIFKSKEGHQIFHFKDLRIRADSEITRRINLNYQELKNDLETRELIEIDSFKMKRFYQQICQLKSLESQGKRNSIKGLLQKYQRKHMDNLKSIARLLATGDGAIFQKQTNLDQIALKFNQAIIWQNKLKTILDNGSDKELTQIAKALFDTTKLWLRLFEFTFADIALIFADLSLELINKKILGFRKLEAALYSISYFDNSTPLDYFHQEIFSSFRDIKFKCEIRLIEVLKHVQYASIPIGKIQHRPNSQEYLSKLLQMCFSDIKRSLEERYVNQYQGFKVDSDFIRYYINFRNSQVPANKVIKEALEANVRQFFNKLFKQYQQKRLVSKQQAAQLAQFIRESIKKLPAQLRQLYNNCLETINQQKVQKKQPKQQEKTRRQLITEYLTEYLSINKESKFKYFLENKYKGDGQLMIQQMFVGRAFQNFESNFYSNLQSESTKPVDIRRFKDEVSANVQINLTFNRKYKEVKQKQKTKAIIQKVDQDIRKVLAKIKQR